MPKRGSARRAPPGPNRGPECGPEPIKLRLTLIPRTLGRLARWPHPQLATPPTLCANPRCSGRPIRQIQARTRRQRVRFRAGRPEKAPKPSISASLPSSAASRSWTSLSQAKFSSLGSLPSARSASFNSLFSVRDLRCKVTTWVHQRSTSSGAASARAGQSDAWVRAAATLRCTAGEIARRHGGVERCRRRAAHARPHPGWRGAAGRHRDGGIRARRAPRHGGP